MTTSSSGYLPDRPRPTWFALTLIVVFMSLLALPLDKVLRRWATPVDENRVPVARPEPTWTLNGMLAYRKAFGAYFNDNFASRRALLAVDHLTRAGAFRVSPVSNVLMGREGWLYFLGEEGKSLDRWFRSSPPFSDPEIVGLRTELLHRRDYLASLGIAYVVVVVPEKYSVYPEYLPAWASQLQAKTSLDRIADEMARYPRLTFVDLREPLRSAKPTDRLYYKTDSHWNYLGATVGYHALMKVLATLLPDLPIVVPAQPAYVTGTDVYVGDLARMVGMQEWIAEEDVAPLWKVLSSPESRCARHDESRESPGFEVYVYKCAQPRRYRALMYRDSMAISLIPMLSENFAESIYVSSRKMDPALIERMHPDIVIEEMVERSLNAPPAFPIPMQ